MFNGIKFREFLSTYQEWHALVEGFCDGFFPFINKYQPSKELKEAIEGEHHYYRPGVILGVIAVVIFWVIIYKVIFW